MSTELSITINYYDDENSAKSYQIYYSSKFEVFIDYRRNGGEINWINIKDSCEIVIHYLEHTRTIKNIESIIIKPRFKDIIKQKGLINIKGRDIFQISELCTKNKVKANDFAIQVRNMLESIKIYSIIDKEVADRLNYINDHIEQIEELFKFVLNYESYLNLKSYDNYNDPKDMVLKRLCIGIMKIESDIIKRDYVIYHCNNIDIDADIENSNLLFLFRPNIAKTIIHCLKNEPTEIVLNIVNKLFRNYDINELNSTTPKEIIDIIVQILGDIKEKNYKTIKNEEKVLTLAQK